MKSVTRKDQEVVDMRRSLDSQNPLKLEDDNDSHLSSGRNSESCSPVDRLDIKQQNILSSSPENSSSSPVNSIASAAANALSMNVAGNLPMNQLAQVSIFH